MPWDYRLEKVASTIHCTDPLLPPPGPCKMPVPEPVLSVLRAAYGDDQIGETGKKLEGHGSHTGLARTEDGNACLIYGEMLPSGLSKALADVRLEAAAGVQLVELGMGTGKLALQAFLQYPNLRRVFGVELAESRYEIAEAVLSRLAPGGEAASAFSEFCGATSVRLDRPHQGLVQLVVSGGEGGERILEFAQGDMFSSTFSERVTNADIVLMEVCLPDCVCEQYCELLSTLKDGSRVLTFYDLVLVWLTPLSCRLERIWPEEGRNWDMFATSWAKNDGFPFYCWTCRTSMEPVITMESAAEARRNEPENIGKTGSLGVAALGLGYLACVLQ